MRRNRQSENIVFFCTFEGLRRVDVPEISREALREAIINAFCHRDWRDPDYIQIAIFKDRVEIRNPGGLVDDLTFEDLRRGNVSRRRNPLIAELFRRIHLVESWGRGMPLILENAPDVSFREVAGLFIARFERPTFSVETTVEAPETTLEMPETTLEMPETTLEIPEATLGTPKKREGALADSYSSTARYHNSGIGAGDEYRCGWR